MTCPSENNPVNRISTLTARYVLNGEYSATVEFIDADCLDGAPCVGFCYPITAGIDLNLVRNTSDTYNYISPDGDNYTGTLGGLYELYESLDECYGVNPNWVNGLMREYERSNAEFTSTYDVSSYFEYLNEKAISTQLFLGETLSTVLSTIFLYYAGVPPSLYDLVSYDDNFIKGPVEGNSLWDELRLLAQAGCADLFVQVGGILTIERWKDNNSPVELVIPDQVMISAEKAKFRSPNTTAIRVRGASVTGFSQGSKPLTNNEEGPGSISKCVLSGLKTPVVEVSFNNLNGNENDIRNADLLASDFQVFKERAKIKDGSFKSKVRNIDPEDFFGPNPKSSTFIVNGSQRSNIDEKLGGRQSAKKRNSSRSVSNLMQSAANYGYPTPYSSFGKGAFGSEEFNNSDIGNEGIISDRTSLQQVETVLFNPQYSECGISFEEIENKYVVSKLLLFKLASRRYQELLLSQNTWNVEIAYFPCIKLNQVVEFKVPPTKNCPEKIVKGIVGGVDVSHTSEDGVQNTTMSLSIMDTGCLGITPYVSDNLVLGTTTAFGLSSEGWQTSPNNLNNQVSIGDCIFLFNKGGAAPVYAQYFVTDLVVGDEYEWSFEYYASIGAPAVIFTTTGFSGSTTVSGTGIQSGSFTATSSSGSFRWQLAPTGLITGARICSFRFIANKDI